MTHSVSALPGGRFVLLYVAVSSATGCGLLFNASLDDAEALESGQNAGAVPVNGSTRSSDSSPDSTLPAHCSNRERDGDESATDCGGTCLGCALGEACVTDADCSSGHCGTANTCEAPNRSEALNGTVAYFDFSESIDGLLQDSTGSHTVTLLPGATLTPGPFGGSDLAFHLPTTFRNNAEGFAHVPHSESWQLQRGSIDLWIKAPAADVDVRDVPIWGLVGRDSSGLPEPNHFNMGILRHRDSTAPEYASESGWLFVRQQLQEQPGEDWRPRTFAFCAATPLKRDTWQHVAFNFGGGVTNELFIDGMSQRNRSGGGES